MFQIGLIKGRKLAESFLNFGQNSMDFMFHQEFTSFRRLRGTCYTLAVMSYYSQVTHLILHLRITTSFETNALNVFFCKRTLLCSYNLLIKRLHVTPFYFLEHFHGPAPELILLLFRFVLIKSLTVFEVVMTNFILILGTFFSLVVVIGLLGSISDP